MTVAIEQVALFLGRADDTVLNGSMAQAIAVVTLLVKAYVRGGESWDIDNYPELEAMVVTAAARLATNPGVVDQDMVRAHSPTRSVVASRLDPGRAGGTQPLPETGAVAMFPLLFEVGVHAYSLGPSDGAVNLVGAQRDRGVQGLGGLGVGGMGQAAAVSSG